MQPIHLRPMSPEEYSAWNVSSRENYAREKEKSGLSPEDARLEAERSFANLLPDGRATTDHHLYTIVENASGRAVGTLWWGPQKNGTAKVPWIYDIVLDESVRGRGWGRAAMRLAEEDVVAKGHSRLGLHVFGHNHVARRLYESLGFEATSVVMFKDLAN